MNNVAANVVSGNQPIRAKLMLKAQIPLVNVRLFQIPGKHGINSVQGERAVLIERDREGISSGHACPRIIEGRAVHQNACALRRRVPLSSILVHVWEIEKDSVGRTEDG